MPASFQPISHLRSYLKIEPSTLLLLCFKAILEVKLAGSCIGELGPQRMNAESVSPSPNSISTYVLPLSFMLTEAVQIAPPSRLSLCLSLKYINEKAHMQPWDKCWGVYVWPMSGCLFYSVFTNLSGSEGIYEISRGTCQNNFRTQMIFSLSCMNVVILLLEV